MARAVAELENEIRALTAAEKVELLDVLLSELDAPTEELGLLAKELIDGAERAGKALGAAVSRLEGLDEELKRGRIEAREAVLRSGEKWPFELPSNFSQN